MSESDPYAPSDAPNVEEASFVLPAVPATAPEKPEKAPQTEEQAVPTGSIKEVLVWVGEDATRAKAALDAETSGDKRKTLVKELNTILDK